MEIYYVSVFGDISVESVDEGILLKTTDLSLFEQQVVKKIVNKLGPKALKDKDDYENMNILYKDIKLSKVCDIITGFLKGNKPTITAIKVSENDIKLVKDLSDDDVIEYKNSDVVVVDRPTRGCPLPSITERKNIRADRVLRKFLNENQLIDYNDNGSFISIGNWTSKRYIVSSRMSKNVETYGQLYDIANNRILCAQCFDMPPAEEVLSLKLSIENMEKEFLQTAHGHIVGC